MPIESKDLAALRRDYSRQELSKSSVAADPLVQFANWFEEYLNSQPLEPNAMTLSTAGSDARPSSRVVLLKGFGPDGFIFFTNYESAKARQLTENPQVSLHFFWPELERQVAISGTASKTSREESESYFLSRPLESRIGAWASKQSNMLADRKELEERIAEIRARFGEDVPCPPFWGGFRVVPDRIEFWQGRPSRLHDRIVYTRSGDVWEVSRLSP
jgi:pyridoxamine 5'-phosphate oxidase